MLQPSEYMKGILAAVDAEPSLRTYRHNKSVLRKMLMHSQSGKCAWCRADLAWKVKTDRYPTLDHIVPRSKGGADDASNLAVVCPSCNVAKGNMCLTRFRMQHGLECRVPV